MTFLLWRSTGDTYKLSRLKIRPDHFTTRVRTTHRRPKTPSRTATISIQRYASEEKKSNHDKNFTRGHRSSDWSDHSSHDDSFGTYEKSSTESDSSANANPKSPKKDKLMIIIRLNTRYRRALDYRTYGEDNKSQVFSTSVERFIYKTTLRMEGKLKLQILYPAVENRQLQYR